MNTTGLAQFSAYGPDRFPAHLPFGERGYLFTVPGTFPDDTPAHTNVTDWEMAVYRTRDNGAQCWEVRDVNGDRRVWGEANTRREAVGRAEQRVAIGLEPVPPYAVETTHSVTLVTSPDLLGILNTIEAAPDSGHPATYHAFEIATGGYRTVQAGDHVQMHTVSSGLFHERCDCDPDDAARFENEPDALAYARQALTTCWPCPYIRPVPSPAGPRLAVDDAQAADVGEADRAQVVYEELTDNFFHVFENAQDARARIMTAGLAMIANRIRRHMPTATAMNVRAEDYTVIAVFAGSTVAWEEHMCELPGGLHFELCAALTDVLTFGDDPEVLADAGWVETASRGVFTVQLPPAE